VRKLHGEMSQSADALDGNNITRLDVHVADGVYEHISILHSCAMWGKQTEGRHASAEKRRSNGGVQSLWNRSNRLCTQSNILSVPTITSDTYVTMSYKPVSVHAFTYR
jgi:hypothetical protein